MAYGLKASSCDPLIGLNLNTTFKFRLPETFSRYQPRPQPFL